MIDSDYSNEVYERRGKKYAPEPRNDRDISYLPHPSWKTKKHYEFNKEPQYYNMEGYMNRKGRVLTRDEFRNSIPEGNPGDKYYKQADREPDFYKKGNAGTEKQSNRKSTITLWLLCSNCRALLFNHHATS